MRLLMLGTGPFAVPTFRRLYETTHQVAALVTGPLRVRAVAEELHRESPRLKCLASALRKRGLLD